MPSQTTTYLNGDRSVLSEDDVLALARSASFGVPVGFIVGMAVRESGLHPYEIDTDYDADGNPRTLKTYGLLQVNRLDAAVALVSPDEDSLCDPATNIKIGSTVLDKYRTTLNLAAGGSSYSEDDMLCYMAWAHNNGIGAVAASVTKYGLDWAALKSRPQNTYMTGRLIPYAEAILAYAKKYPGDPSSGAAYEEGTSDADVEWWVKLAALGCVGWAAWRYYKGKKVIP